MKYLFLMVLFLSNLVFSGQGTLLSIARDSYLRSSVQVLSEYCQKNRPDLPLDQNYLFICFLQVKADCSHGEEERKASACEAQTRAESLEKMVLVSDKNLSQVEPIPVGVNLSAPQNSKIKLNDHPGKDDVSAVIVKPHIPDISRMSEREWIDRGKPNKLEFQKTAEEWIAATNKLNATTVKRNCSENAHCKLQFYGSGGCVKGRSGFIATNTEEQPKDFLEALTYYNEVQKKALTELKLNYMCAAVIREYKAICRENICTGITFNP